MIQTGIIKLQPKQTQSCTFEATSCCDAWKWNPLILKKTIIKATIKT